MSDVILWDGGTQFVGRYLKPGFKYQSTKSLVCPASSTKPAYFIIGARRYKVTSDLECSLLTSGVGGLASGVSAAANTVYYLYAVYSNDKVQLIADTNDPDTGVRGFTDWTYLGAFWTARTTATIPFFKMVKGLFQSTRRADASHTGDTSLTAKTFLSPTTSHGTIGLLVYDGTVVGAFGDVHGSNADDDELFAQLSVTTQDVTTTGIVYTEVAGTVWLQTSNASNTTLWRANGWIEDPSEFP